MLRFYDQNKNRLVYLGEAASSEFWDEQWSSCHTTKRIESTRNPIITGKTKKYLPKGSRVLEGGCGQGQYVYLLEKSGFSTIGVDFAKKTVKKINELYPSLDIRFDDIRNMDFDNGFFDGYWSFGTIEHFYDGYDDVVIEMCRVLRPQGYLFMIVPTMSPLRKYLSQKGKYPLWEDENQDVNKFYQFALDANKIVIDFEKAGFKLCEMRPYGGLKGFKDEVTFLKPLLQPVFDNQNIFVKAIKIFLDFVLQPIAAHTTLFVFQKNE
jgi:SAM-dependent methyltransferase